MREAPALRQLTAHFFRGLFDFGVLTEMGADSLRHMLLGGAGALVAVGFFLTRIYAGKYAALRAAITAEPYRRALLGDDLFIIGAPMLLSAFVTLLVSHSLFPDERDFRILGPLPVRRPVVFAAKLTALGMFGGAVVAVTHLALAPLVILTSFSRWSEHAAPMRLVVWLVAGPAACGFAMLAMATTAGVLRGIAKSALLAGLVMCVPLVLQLPALGTALSAGPSWLILLPPAWFVGLERWLLGTSDPWFGRLAALALTVTASVTIAMVLIYVRLFRSFERLMLRPVAGASGRGRSDRLVGSSRAAPARRAIQAFTTATLRRSPLHQGALAGVAACGMGLAVSRLASAPASEFAAAAVWTPFAVMFMCAVGLRVSLALPHEQRANWIFKTTEDEAMRRDLRLAVDRVAAAVIVGPPVVAGAALLWIPFGAGAVIAVAVVALIGFVLAQIVLQDWRRVPFTASYVPGKRFIVQSVVVGFVRWLVFTLAGTLLVRGAVSGISRALVIAALLGAAIWLRRRRRIATSIAMPLTFEDELPDQVFRLQL